MGANAKKIAIKAEWKKNLFCRNINNVHLFFFHGKQKPIGNNRAISDRQK